jgi:hypothetical protein
VYVRAAHQQQPHQLCAVAFHNRGPCEQRDAVEARIGVQTTRIERHQQRVPAAQHPLLLALAPRVARVTATLAPGAEQPDGQVHERGDDGYETLTATAKHHFCGDERDGAVWRHPSSITFAVLRRREGEGGGEGERRVSGLASEPGRRSSGIGARARSRGPVRAGPSHYHQASAARRMRTQRAG